MNNMTDATDSLHTATAVVWVGTSADKWPTQLTILWNAFKRPSDPNNVVSLPAFIEENDRVVRERVLKYLVTIKNAEVKNKTTFKHLTLASGYSYWWSTLIALKRWRNSGNIPFACKIVALEMLMELHNIRSINVESDEPELRSRILECIRRPEPSKILSYFLGLKSLMIDLGCFLFHLVRALGSFAHYLYETRKVPKIENQSSLSKQMLFIDFYNASEPTNQGHQVITSTYWGGLPQWLQNNSTVQPDWLHNFPENIDNRKIRTATNTLKNRSDENFGSHSLLLFKPTRETIIESTRSYFLLIRKFWTLRAISKVKYEHSLGTNLWPLFKGEWRESLIGSTAIRHCLLIASVERFVRLMPKYEQIVYLMENQPWESPFIYSCTKHGQGRLFGVAHSTVRFWDLRYFQHQDEHSVNSEADHPSPHIIVVNGSEAKSLLQDNRWLTDNQIVVAEALRYGYLSTLTRTRTIGKSDLPHLVVLGDFLPSANTFLLTKLHESQKFTTTKFRMSLRSHPICKFNSDETRSFNDSITDVDLKTLLESADVVLTTANSSSAAESVSLGIPTILMVDPESLNYSPFRKTELAQFVTTAEELSSALIGFNDLVSSQIPDFFCLDDDYPRWRNLLSID